MSSLKLLNKLAEIGVNLTNNDKEIIEWRLSEEGKQYYSRRQNNQFYKALSKGDMSVVDIVRKEKQQKIDDFFCTRAPKNEGPTLIKCLFGAAVLLILLLASVSCVTTQLPDDIKPQLSESALLSYEKSYRLEEADPVKVKGAETPNVSFKNSEVDWFVVSEDFIKDHNENQDRLILMIDKFKDQETESKRLNWIFGLAGLVLGAALSIIIMAISNRRRN